MNNSCKYYTVILSSHPHVCVVCLVLQQVTDVVVTKVTRSQKQLHIQSWLG